MEITTISELKNDDINELICPLCNSPSILKNGRRKTRIGLRQRYSCKDCGKRFVADPLKNHLMTARMLAFACNLYSRKLSLRDVRDVLYQDFGFKINHETIRKNILKCAELLSDYTNTLNPKLGKRWCVDEQMVKCKGKFKYAWNAIDKKTRWLIATLVSSKRSIKDARRIFKKAKNNLNIDKRDDYFKGLVITTDGLHSYREAIRKEFLTQTMDGVTHRRTNHPKVHKSENMQVERYHNEYRQFDKTRRDFKTKKTLEKWNNFFRVYSNFVKKNNGNYLRGLTPAEVAGIYLPGKSKWLSLIKLGLSPELDKQRYHP